MKESRYGRSRFSNFLRSNGVYLALAASLLAVGGVNEKNIADFLAAGAVGAGVGGNLVNKIWIANGEFDKITALAEEFVKNAGL